MTDPLGPILKKVDASAETPFMRSDMARRVRRSYQRRRIIRSAATVTAALGLTFAISTLIDRHPQPLAKSTTPPSRPDLRLAETDAKLHQLIADLLEKHERDSVIPQDQVAEDYLWHLSQQTNRAALILVHSGDEIYSRFHDATAAEADYQQAIQDFPGCPAADLAQARLRSLEHKGNEL